MTIKEQISEYKDEIKQLINNITKLQDSCTHEGVHIKYRADTGNYCKQDDSYWIDWKCNICGKSWTTDQDTEAYHLAKELKAVKI